MFKKVKLDQEFESFVWENGIDLCPDDLYEMSSDSKQERDLVFKDFF